MNKCIIPKNDKKITETNKYQFVFDNKTLL